MGTFQVKRFVDGGDYEKVKAETAKKAAEKFYGRELSVVGTTAELRVMVHEMKWPRDPGATLFYDRG